jgi:hypothetical protein
MAKREPKDDLQIAAILDQHLKFTTGYQDSKLSKERTRVLEHYDGELPRPTSRGNSKYVSQDVFESVEALKATVLEVFSTNKEIVSFTPSGPDDVELSRIATEYCSFIVFRKNNGLDVLTDVLDDGLLARVGVVQFSWEDHEQYDDDEIGPADLQTLAAHPVVSHPDTTVNSLDDHTDGTYTAQVTKKTKKGCVTLDVVPPEDFGITARAKDIKSAKLVYRRQAMTRGELLAEGYAESLIDRLPSDPAEMQLDQEKSARFEQLDVQRAMTDDTGDLERQQHLSDLPLLRQARHRRHRHPQAVVRLQVRPDHPEERARVDAALRGLRPAPQGTQLLRQLATPPRSSRVQNARTVLTRTILDHAVITTHAPLRGGQGRLDEPEGADGQPRWRHRQRDAS